MYRISFILRLEGGGDNLGAGVTENQRCVDVTSCDRTIHDSERDQARYRGAELPYSVKIL